MEFVNFPIAKKLKEKGFNEYCDMYYHIYNDVDESNWSLESTGDGSRSFLNSLNSCRCAAPTIAQVLKWLREEKGIHLDIGLYLYCYGFDVMQISPKRKLAWSGTKEFPTYESAALAGIEYVLDNLI